MKYILLSFFLALSACRPSTSEGLTPIAGEEKYSVLQTVQDCNNGDLLVRNADLGLVLIAREAQREGLIDYSSWAEYLKDHWIWMCMIDQPEECPRGSSLGRKAGCTHSFGTTLWVSRVWPPLCPIENEHEKICVNSPAEQKEVWQATIVHELINVLNVYLGIYDPQYKTDVWKPGGLEDRVMKTYQTVLQSEQ